MSVAHIAIEKDRVDVVGFLLKKGADIKALMWVCLPFQHKLGLMIWKTS
jgi:hypothetical protein